MLIEGEEEGVPLIHPTCSRDTRFLNHPTSSERLNLETSEASSTGSEHALNLVPPADSCSGSLVAHPIYSNPLPACLTLSQLVKTMSVLPVVILIAFLYSPVSGKPAEGGFRAVECEWRWCGVFPVSVV